MSTSATLMLVVVVVATVSLLALFGGLVLALLGSGLSRFLSRHATVSAKVTASQTPPPMRVWPVFAVGSLTLLACALTVWVIAEIAASAPRAAGEAAAAPSGRPTSLPATPLPAVLLPTPLPDAGGGYVKGQLLWNGKPVAGAQVALCVEASYALGCQGLAASAQSDQDGYYLMADTPPGEYALAVRAPDAAHWVYFTEGLGINPARYTVVRDQTLQIAPQNIYLFNVRLLEPATGSVVKSATPVLRWAPYAEADFYEVYLTPENGEPVFVSFQASSPELAVAEPLQNCVYYWQVEAISRQFGKLAESEQRGMFRVTDQPTSCAIDLAQPAPDAVIDRDRVELAWQPHARAATYRLLLWNESSPARDLALNQVVVSATTYRLTEALPPGAYVWAVYADDASGRQVAGSEIRRFQAR